MDALDTTEGRASEAFSSADTRTVRCPIWVWREAITERSCSVESAFSWVSDVGSGSLPPAAWAGICGAPQLRQKLAVSAISRPQLEQFIPYHLPKPAKQLYHRLVGKFGVEKVRIES